jgi:hypothetical protein
MRITKPSRRVTAIGSAAALLVGGIVAVAAPAQAAANTYTALPLTAKGATATSVPITVTLTGKDFKSATGASKVDTVANGGVVFATSCGTSMLSVSGKVADVAAAGVVPAIYGGVSAVTVVSATKLVLTARAIPLGAGNTTAAYKICVYGTAATGNPLLGSATFTVYPAPTIDNNGVTPAAGDYRGGETVVITGTNFTKTATVKVDTVAMTNVKFIDDKTLTGTMPAKTIASADNNPDFVITTEGGSNAPDNDYTYTRGINISPNHGPTAGGTDITVTGSNFLGLNFTPAVGSDNSAVVFSATPYLGTAAADAGDTAEFVCGNVQVISDNELVCTSPAGMANQSYTVSVLYADDYAVPAAANVSKVTSGSTWTAAAY